jgi:hypothetical protein
VATGIAVWGTDVYVSGAEHNGQAWGAKVWKNGVPTLLSGGTLDANALGLAVVRR